MNLGRGGDGRIRMTSQYVFKKAPPWEPWYMVRFPDAFVRVLRMTSCISSSEVEFAMPRLQVPRIPLDSAAAIRGGYDQLMAHVWSQSRLYDEKPNWRSLLKTHLHEINERVDDFPDVWVDSLVDGLREPVRPVAIHGDATLANILYIKELHRWVWCDPLDRPYIPYDVDVDLGKMIQSAYGYERVILGQWEKPVLDHSLLPFAIDENAHDWCMIHFMRLLPYQDERCREIFLNFLWEQNA